MAVSVEDIKHQLAEIIDPWLEMDYATAGIIRHVSQAGSGAWQVALRFPYPIGGLEPAIRELIDTALSSFSISKLDLSLTSKIAPRVRSVQAKPLPGVANVIAVASGKGGVGKSTVTALLAIALSRCGARVGVLDADIHGPNVAHMLGVDGRIEFANLPMKPLYAGKIPTQSMAYLVDGDAPMIWRGPMASRALKDLIYQTDWGELDYLLVDMPPGTSDIALTLAKSAPVTAYLLVTTAQAASLLDVMRANIMLNKLSLPILGLVENMHSINCEHCGHDTQLFPGDGVSALAARCALPILSTLPFVVSAQPDAGFGSLLSLINKGDSLICDAVDLARRVSAATARLPRDYQHHFGSISVE